MTGHFEEEVGFRDRCGIADPNQSGCLSGVSVEGDERDSQNLRSHVRPWKTGLAGWGGETRTTESIWTESVSVAARILPDLAQGIVQRRFQYELRVREPAAAAADRVHRRARAGQRTSRTGRKIIGVGVRFRSTSAPLHRCAQSLEISSARPYLNQLQNTLRHEIAHQINAAAKIVIMSPFLGPQALGSARSVANHAAGAEAAAHRDESSRSIREEATGAGSRPAPPSS
jgi:hypothetical protein